jgi:hypothetical protein
MSNPRLKFMALLDNRCIQSIQGWKQIKENGPEEELSDVKGDMDLLCEVIVGTKAGGIDRLVIQLVMCLPPAPKAITPERSAVINAIWC